ncbi:hypothetical protein GCM10028786_29170 [Flaviaesturariibacter terrae]
MPAAGSGVPKHRFGSSIVKSITLARENYGYFLSKQSPDSAVALLYRSIGSDTFSNTADGNRLRILRQVERKNVRVFRCFYRSGNTIDRYVDLGPAGELLMERSPVAGADHAIEQRNFYPDGTLRRIRRFHYNPVATRDGSEEPWYTVVNTGLVKEGPDQFYHPNGRMRVTLFYRQGALLDSTYTEWDAGGNLLRTTRSVNGVFRIEKQAKTDNAQARRKAFLVGLDYFSPEPGTPGVREKMFVDLDGAGNDIAMLKRALEAGRGFLPQHIVSISGRQATRTFMLRSFEAFASQVQNGDILFLHFSGQGFLKMTSEGGKTLALPTSDIWRYGKDTIYATDSGMISQKELQAFLHSLQKRAGPTGQVILSLDVCHSGALLSDTTDLRPAATDRERVFARGESPNLLLNFVEDGSTPSAILTATLEDQYSFEMKDENDFPVGAYSYMLARSLGNPFVNDPKELIEMIAESMIEKGLRQEPAVLANKAFNIFEESAAPEAGTLLSLPRVKAAGNAFVLSVGVSKYPSSLQQATFANASLDASSYHQFFGHSFKRFAGSDTSRKIRALLLQDTAATKAGILKGLNDAISLTKPADYFVFNFSGYCRSLKDSSGRAQTWFVPYGLEKMDDEAQIRAQGISLKQLKDLLQLVPANNQLFITEAGSTADFPKEFIQALIEASPTVAALSNKNRIFLVPKSSGLDRFRCAGLTVAHGPLNHYVTSLPAELNIFGIFTDSLYREAIRYALTRSEVTCDYFRTGYFDMFSEKEFVRSLSSLLPEEMMQSRGVAVGARERQAFQEGIGHRYALVVGTDRYAGKPDWRDLDNPVFDARDIAASLKRNFGFDTLLLVDQPSDSLYARILYLSQHLQPSDQLLVYIGGHGDFDDRLFDDGFIVSGNSRAVKEDPYRNTYLQYSKLSRMINRLPATQILMVLDVCFGGTFDERVARNKSRAREYDDLAQAAYVSEKLKKRTRIYLTSGGKREVPDGYKGKHSPFAVRLLEALQTKGGAGRLLTATDLFQFVQKLPSGPLLGSFGDDEPGSEFVMVGQ